MIDLHSHSTASDGRLSPTDLVDRAQRRGLKALALTDHDTVDGLAEAQNAARSRGIALVPGIEIDVEWDRGEFHLLGLGLARWDGDLTQELRDLKGRREERNRRLFELWQEQSLPGSWDELTSRIPGDQLGRPHIARYMIEKRIVKSVSQAFQTWLGPGCPLYVPKRRFSLDQALDWIRRAGGKSVLAHPGSLFLSPGRVEPFLETWGRQGLWGLEAYHPSHSPGRAQRWADLARRWNLGISAGSDYHGDERRDRELGQSSGGRPIPDQWLEQMFPDWADRFLAKAASPV